MKFYTDVQVSKNNLLVRGYDRSGHRVHKKVPYKPYLFVASDDPDSEFKTVYGTPVKKIDFECISDARNFNDQYKDVENFDIYGMQNYAYTYINDIFPTKVDFDHKAISVGYIDIEVGSDDGFPEPSIAAKEITAITLAKNGNFAVFGCRDYVPHKEGVTYIKCADETQLISRFLQVWEKFDLDIVVGWNNSKFDIPYLVNRIRRVLGDTFVNKLSPWGRVYERKIFTKFGEEQLYDIIGISVIDYLDVYQKHSYIPQESYKLDHVAFTDCGISKVDYSEYASLHKFYEENFQKFVEYNIRDVELILALESRHKLLQMIIALAYDSKINYADTLGSVRLWDVIIHNELMLEKLVVDPSASGDKDVQYAGAFVKHPQVGLHEMVASYDVKSLYPSLVVEYNISPETLRERLDMPFSVDMALQTGIPKSVTTYLRENDLTLTANGFTWDRSKQGIFPRIVKRLIALRDSDKAEMLRYEVLYEETNDPEHELLAQQYKILQQVRKIQLNSLYGCMGNQYFRWFRLAAAEGITLSGQLVIQFVEQWLNGVLMSLSNKQKDYVIGMDTDSVYMTLADFVPAGLELNDALRYVHEFTKETISPEVAKAFDAFYESMNGFEKFLFMKLEVIANKGIWTAKKRYVLNVFFKEGVWYETPKIKFVGLEAIKTSTPKVCRDIIKEAVRLVLTGDHTAVLQYVNEEEAKYPTRPFSEIAFPRGVNGIKKYTHPTGIYVKGTPFHVKGAIFYNKALKSHKLDSMYPAIRDGDKIKISYLLMPNPIHSPIICSPNELPDEFKLAAYIDYKKMFDKAVIQPLLPIMNAAGCPIRVVPTLDDLFDSLSTPSVSDQEAEEDFMSSDDDDWRYN